MSVSGVSAARSKHAHTHTQRQRRGKGGGGRKKVSPVTLRVMDRPRPEKQQQKKKKNKRGGEKCRKKRFKKFLKARHGEPWVKTVLTFALIVIKLFASHNRIDLIELLDEAGVQLR